MGRKLKKSMNKEDVALLSRVLVERVRGAAPADEGRGDVRRRLKGAGASFRSRNRPSTSEEVAATVRRLKKIPTQTKGRP